MIWQDDGNGSGSWRVNVDCELFGSITVDIPSRDARSLTPVQQQCLQIIRSLTENQRSSFLDALAKYALHYCGELPDASDLTITCNHASVPYLAHVQTPYLFLDADSSVDQEHGVCFLMRDQHVLCCCHGDMSLDFFGWDAIEELESISEM